MKKIAVCHGPNCLPRGSDLIYKKIKERFENTPMEIVRATCQGRCEHCCVLTVDDETPILDLNPKYLEEDFLNNPEKTFEEAKKRQKEDTKELHGYLEIITQDELF